jgi:ribulose-phosphate 3-epimerase
MIKIAPSILAANFSKLGEEIKAAEIAGADMIHLDIIDGHFAPNITFGKAVSKISKSVSTLPHDAHLMVTDPENYIEDFLKIGVEYITFHIEIGGQKKKLGENRWVYIVDGKPDESRILSLIDRIEKGGCKAGLTLNPPTGIGVAIPFLDKIDLLLLMSVNPGFSGQAFIDNVYDKIEAAIRFRTERNCEFEIMVDGGVGLENADKLRNCGADILVSGSSFYQSSDYSEFIRQLKS